MRRQAGVGISSLRDKELCQRHVLGEVSILYFIHKVWIDISVWKWLFSLD